jgi:dCMP deaminase
MKPSKDEHFLRMASLCSLRTTCARRGVGCVLVDKIGHVLATGYNGVARGLSHCNENNPCSGSTSSGGKDLDKCEAIHAEQNALLQCSDVEKIHTCYTTTFPCIHCLKLLLNTSCERIVYIRDYHHERAKELWLESGRTLTQVDLYGHTIVTEEG